MPRIVERRPSRQGSWPLRMAPGSIDPPAATYAINTSPVAMSSSTRRVKSMPLAA